MHLGPFGCLTKLGIKWVEVVQKFVPRSRVGIFHKEHTRSTPGIFHKEHTRSTPLDPKLTFWCVSYYLGEFATVWLPYGTRCKTVEQVQMFVPRSRIVIFRNERNRSTPLDSKLMFWCLLYYLDAFGNVWLPYKTRWKQAEVVQKFVS